MTPRAAIICYCGFRQIPHHGTGVHRLHTRLCNEVAWDRREYPLVALRPWNSDFDTDAELIEQADAERLIVIGYSYGCGWALPQLAKRIARPIHLACLIDPVKRYGVGKHKSLRRGGTLELPQNVIKAATWWTLNDAGWFCPMGHTVTGAPLVRNVVYGGRNELKQYAPEGADQRVGAGVVHGNIDDLDEIHNDIIGLVRKVASEV